MASILATLLLFTMPESGAGFVPEPEPHHINISDYLVINRKVNPICSVDMAQIEGYGGLSYYDQGPTERMKNIWQEYGYDLGSYDGFIAVSDCSRRGQEAIIQVEDKGPYKVFVFDCAGSVATACWMAEGEILAELGYDLAVKTGVYGRGSWGHIDFTGKYGTMKSVAASN